METTNGARGQTPHSEEGEPTLLTAEQRSRLDQIRSEIQNEKLIVSFSIEARDLHGVRKSAFYSMTASRKREDATADGAETGWSVDESKVVHAVLSQQVVAAVYNDAVRRGILLPEVAKDEAQRILVGYEKQIARFLDRRGPK